MAKKAMTKADKARKFLTGNTYPSINAARVEFQKKTKLTMHYTQFRIVFLSTDAKVTASAKTEKIPASKLPEQKAAIPSTKKSQKKTAPKLTTAQLKTMTAQQIKDVIKKQHGLKLLNSKGKEFDNKNKKGILAAAVAIVAPETKGKGWSRTAAKKDDKVAA